MWPLVVYGMCRWLRLSCARDGVLFGGLAIVSCVWMACCSRERGASPACTTAPTRGHRRCLIGAALARRVRVRRSAATRRSTQRVLAVLALVAVGVTALAVVTRGRRLDVAVPGWLLPRRDRDRRGDRRVVQPKRGVLGAVLSSVAAPLDRAASPTACTCGTGRSTWWSRPTARVSTAPPLLLVRLAVTFAVGDRLVLPRRAARQERRAARLAILGRGAHCRRRARRGRAPRHRGRPPGRRLWCRRPRRVVRGCEREPGSDEQARPGRSRRPRRARPASSWSATRSRSRSASGCRKRASTTRSSPSTGRQLGCGITHRGEVWVEGRVQTISDYCDQVPAWAAAVQELRPRSVADAHRRVGRVRPPHRRSVDRVRCAGVGRPDDPGSAGRGRRRSRAPAARSCSRRCPTTRTATS